VRCWVLERNRYRLHRVMSKARCVNRCGIVFLFSRTSMLCICRARDSFKRQGAGYGYEWYKETTYSDLMYHVSPSKGPRVYRGRRAGHGSQRFAKPPTDAALQSLCACGAVISHACTSCLLWSAETSGLHESTCMHVFVCAGLQWPQSKPKSPITSLCPSIP
jgi:hypothetical protein